MMLITVNDFPKTSLNVVQYKSVTNTDMTEPTPAELAEIWDMTPNLRPARGIIIPLLIFSALWAVIGLVIYFKFFN